MNWYQKFLNRTSTERLRARHKLNSQVAKRFRLRKRKKSNSRNHSRLSRRHRRHSHSDSNSNSYQANNGSLTTDTPHIVLQYPNNILTKTDANGNTLPNEFDGFPPQSLAPPLLPAPLLPDPSPAAPSRKNKLIGYIREKRRKHNNNIHSGSDTNQSDTKRARLRRKFSRNREGKRRFNRNLSRIRRRKQKDNDEVAAKKSLKNRIKRKRWGLRRKSSGINTSSEDNTISDEAKIDIDSDPNQPVFLQECASSHSYSRSVHSQLNSPLSSNRTSPTLTDSSSTPSDSSVKCNPTPTPDSTETTTEEEGEYDVPLFRVKKQKRVRQERETKNDEIEEKTCNEQYHLLTGIKNKLGTINGIITKISSRYYWTNDSYDVTGLPENFHEQWPYNEHRNRDQTAKSVQARYVLSNWYRHANVIVIDAVHGMVLRFFDEHQPFLDEYSVIKLVGEGTFSKVFQCRNLLSNKISALKVYSKQLLIASNQVGHIDDERKLFDLIRHENEHRQQQTAQRNYAKQQMLFYYKTNSKNALEMLTPKCLKLQNRNSGSFSFQSESISDSPLMFEIHRSLSKSRSRSRSKSSPRFPNTPMLDSPNSFSFDKDLDLLVDFVNPFVITAKCSFQDEACLYYVYDYLSGGELFFHLKQRVRFHLTEAKYIGAQVALGIAFLHQFNYIWRSCKPEDILLDNNGFVTITDFGCGKILANNEDEKCENETMKSNTFCWSIPEYVPPEMLKKDHSHGLVADWWSFGCLLFELATGAPPFWTIECQTHEQIYLAILNKQLEFPSIIDMFQAEKENDRDNEPDITENDMDNYSAFQDLCRRLLNKDPAQRLGSDNDFKEIMNHPFFAEVDFEKLIKKEVMLPYMIPEVRDVFDYCNIDQNFISNTTTIQSFKNKTLYPKINTETDPWQTCDLQYF